MAEASIALTRSRVNECLDSYLEVLTLRTALAGSDWLRSRRRWVLRLSRRRVVTRLATVGPAGCDARLVRGSWSRGDPGARSQRIFPWLCAWFCFCCCKTTRHSYYFTQTTVIFVKGRQYFIQTDNGIILER